MYVRSRKHQGLGQFAPGAPLTAFNTQQPVQMTAEIPQASMATAIPNVMAQMLPYNPAGPIDPGSENFSQPATHRAPPADAGLLQVQMYNLSQGSSQPGGVVSIGPSGQISSGGGGVNVQAPSGLPQDSGSGAGTTGGATVTPAAFKSACEALGGSMGTSCCKLPSGAAVGLDANGQMVQVASCDAGGMGSMLLIAAAVVGVFLVSRMF